MFRNKRRGNKKTTYRRKKRVTRPRRRTNQGTVYRFKRAVKLDQFSTSNVAAVGKSYQFSLNQLPNFSEFTALYDTYKLAAVKFKMVPRLTDAGVSTTANSHNTSPVHSAIDYDDANTTNDPLVLMQYQNYKMTRGLSLHQRYLKPKMAELVYVTGVSSGYGQGRRWINCSNPDVPHYAVKLAIEPTAVALQYDVYATYYVMFKAVR